MHKGLVHFIMFLCLFTSVVHADEVVRRKLSDGSVLTEQKNSDGNKVVQIQRPNGIVETTTLDSEGNQTTTIQYPDGRIEMKSHSKS